MKVGWRSQSLDKVDWKLLIFYTEPGWWLWGMKIRKDGEKRLGLYFFFATIEWSWLKRKSPIIRWLSFVDQDDDDENYGYDDDDENDKKKHTHTMTFQ